MKSFWHVSVPMIKRLKQLSVKPPGWPIITTANGMRYMFKPVQKHRRKYPWISNGI
jgi:hypothetical protein